MKIKLFFAMLGLGFVGTAQTVLDELSAASYDNFAKQYNYNYWDQNWKNSITGDRNLIYQTSNFAMNINYTDLNINSLNIVPPGKSRDEGFAELKSTTFQNQYAGEINYAILQNGTAYASKANSPTGTGAYDTQNAEDGIWCNKRFISTFFDRTETFSNPSFTGLEFSNWHDRFRITFHLKPTVDIQNGALQFEIEIPEQYNQKNQSGDVYGFSDGNGNGFAIKASSNAESISINGNKITVKSIQQDFITDMQYEVGLLFYAINENFSTNYSAVFDKDQGCNITVTNDSPQLNQYRGYDAEDGVYLIGSLNINMGYKNCNNVNNRSRLLISVNNPSSEEKKVRLCFYRLGGADIVGYSSRLTDKDGNPIGLPIQVSKNWHGGDTKFFSGIWIRDYTEIIVPPNTTLNFDYLKAGAKWGTVYAVNSDQLSVNHRGAWLEASMGGFGENLTHSPDYEFGNTMAADVRPFLVDASINHTGLSGNECDWTGNVGGFDFWVYKDSSGKRLYNSETKTQFSRYSPNLSETTISALSGDKKLKMDYTFYLNRTDDLMRVYYKVKVKALESTSFDRFDFFQLGGDSYNHAKATSYAYGNDLGMNTLATPICNSATAQSVELSGNNPWVWAGESIMVGGKTQHRYPANRGFVIRDYKAIFNGVENNTPYIIERCKTSTLAPSYSIVPPPNVNSFTTGDEVEFIVEVAILPKLDGDYYGPNANFAKALEDYGSSWELFFREVVKNKIIAESPTNVVHTSYPLTVETVGNKGLVTITGGAGYIPLVFSGLSTVKDPKLWKSYNNCWELVDQSYYGKDFWQTDYDPISKTFELIYNVNQDLENDETAVIQYYLGNTPPEPNIVIQSVIVGNPWSANANLEVVTEEDAVIFGPQVTENGTTSKGINTNWIWSGPNGFSKTGRVVSLSPVTDENIGNYTVTYSNEYGCIDSKTYSITSNANLSIDEFENEFRNFKVYPNPTENTININATSNQTIIYDINGKIVYFSKEPMNSFNIENLETGIYFVKFKKDENEILNRFLKK